MDDLIRLIGVLNETLRVLSNDKQGHFTVDTRQLIYNQINEATKAILLLHKTTDIK